MNENALFHMAEDIKALAIAKADIGGQLSQALRRIEQLEKDNDGLLNKLREYEKNEGKVEESKPDLAE